MKKLSIFLFVLLLLVGGAILLGPRLIPIDAVKQHVQKAVRDETGRELQIAGDVKVSVFPNISVVLNEVALSNAPWGTHKQMATLGALDIQLALKPLLRKEVQIKQFVLREPAINIEINKNGKGNWEFETLDAKPKAEPQDGGETASAPTAVGGLKIGLGEFRLEDGQLTFVNHQTGAKEHLGDIDATVNLPTLADTLELKGDMDYRGRNVKVDLTVEQFEAFLSGAAVKGAFALAADNLKADYAGTLSLKDNAMLRGKTSAQVDNIANLMKWLSPEAAAVPFDTLAFDSGLMLAKGSAAFSGMSLELDEIKGKGDVYANWSGAKFWLKADLGINKLNLDRFLAAAGADVEPGGKGKAKAGDEGWSDEKIDMSGLNSLDADLKLRSEGLSVKGAELGATVLTATLKNGVLDASIPDTDLFQGKVRGKMNVDATAKVQKVKADFNLKGVQAKPVLTTFAGFSKLSGTTDADVKIRTHGRSQKTMIGNLGGNGKFAFHNGSIEGVNIVDIAKKIQNKLQDMGKAEGRTEFVLLDGTFVITDGIVTNDDLAMSGPLVEVSGAGKVDLPKKYVDYRINPVLTAQAKSETGGVSGLKIPVDVKGPFSNIKFKPDFSGAIKGALDNPEETVKNLKETGSKLKEKLKSGEKPEDVIKGLFGGFGGGDDGGATQKEPAWP